MTPLRPVFHRVWLQVYRQLHILCCHTHCEVWLQSVMHAQRCLKLCVMQTAESDFAVSSCTPWSNSGGHDDTAKSVEKFCFLDSPPQSMKPRCPPCTCTLHSAHCRERMVELRARISRKYRNCIRKYFYLFFKGQMRISNEKISILIHYLQSKKKLNLIPLIKK